MHIYNYQLSFLLYLSIFPASMCSSCAIHRAPTLTGLAISLYTCANLTSSIRYEALCPSIII